MSSVVASKALGALVTVGAAAGVVAYVQHQLHTESQTMDRFFSTYNTPESEESRRRVFDGATEDPRTNLANVLSWKHK